MSETLPDQKTLVAARWLASKPCPDRPHPIIPALQQRFGLTAAEAIQAIREASLLQARVL